MKARELREMSDEELRQELENYRKELFNLRHQKVVGQLDNPAQMRKARREIARILTILRERELQAAKKVES